MDNNNRNQNRGTSRDNIERRTGSSSGQNGMHSGRPQGGAVRPSGQRTDAQRSVQLTGAQNDVQRSDARRAGVQGNPQRDVQRVNARCGGVGGDAQRHSAAASGAGHSRDAEQQNRTADPRSAGSRAADPRAVQNGARPADGRTARSLDRSGRPQQSRTKDGKAPADKTVRRRRRRNTVLISIAAFVAVLTVVVLVLWKVVDDYTPDQDPGPSPDETTAPVSETVDDDGTPPVPAASSIERKPGYYTMLAVGHDQVAVNTDVIMLASYDVTNKKISVLQIPRDTYFELYGKARKINSLFALERDTTVKDADARIRSGMEGMADELERGLGIPIDFWAMVDLDQFGNLVDAVGGVPIDLPCDMDYEDPEQDLYIHLKKGQQILNGDTAEQYIRFRKGNNGYAQGDIGRVDAMKVFMSALFRQVKNNLSISTVPKLAETAINMVDTDMKVLDCVYFGKNFMKSVDMSNVNFVTLPGEAVNSGTSYYVMNKAGMLELMNEYFNPYKVDITEAMLDPTGMFGGNAEESVSAVYAAPASETLGSSVHSAGDINDNGLNIARTGGGN